MQLRINNAFTSPYLNVTPCILMAYCYKELEFNIKGY